MKHCKGERYYTEKVSGNKFGHLICSEYQQNCFDRVVSVCISLKFSRKRVRLVKGGA